jgi:rhodanese-related sulfurtransferase
MVDRRHKDALYEQIARIGKAVAAPRRLELLDLLGQAPRTVEALADLTGMSIANTSQHLQVLRASGLVDAAKDGLYVTYRLASPDVAQCSLQLRNLAETRLAEMERVKRQFFAAAANQDDGVEEGIDAVGGKELLTRVRTGQVVLLDVRPEEEFDAAHISGAISIPHNELKRRLAELPKRREIVAYCRGPYCVFAIEAVKLLRARGFKAARIEDGVTEWRARGLPIIERSMAASS